MHGTLVQSPVRTSAPENPSAGPSAPANLNTWPVLCLQFTFQCKVSQNHCQLGQQWGRGCPVLGTPQATQPLARGYGEGNLLFKEKGEQPCTKNSGCADSEAGRSSTLSSMGSWPTRWLSAPFPGAVERHQELGSCLGAPPAADPRVCPAKCPHCHLRSRCHNLGFFQQDFPGLLEPVLQTSVMGLNCQGTRPLWTAFTQGPTADGSPLPGPQVGHLWGGSGAPAPSVPHRTKFHWLPAVPRRTTRPLAHLPEPVCPPPRTGRSVPS